jgi:PST family polysaccharide transporter
VYLFASSSVAKVVSVGAYVVLGYLLSEDAFGVFALAGTITVFIQVIEQGGVGDVLVQRKNFRQWAIPGFWLAASLGLLSTLLILIAAPIASALYENRQLYWLLLILAPSSIPNALSVVPRAQLARQLRFRALAIVNLASLVIRLTMTVVLAWLGYGAYSFVIPVPISSVLITGCLWCWTSPPWSSSAQLKKWRYLIGDSARILTAELQRAFIDQSDYILLGIFRSAREVGIYLFGFSFSIQILQLIAFNLMNVLFPAFAKLNDRPQIQYQGFIKAQRILAMVGISACLLQAATAAPFTHLLLAPKWAPSIRVMQILSIGMALRMVAGSSFALLKSQGRFRAILWNRWAFVALQVVGLTIALWLGGGINAVATVVGSVSTLIGPVTFFIAIRPYGAGWREVGNVLYRPVICSVLSIGTAWLIGLWMEVHGFGPLPQLIETVVVAAALSLIFARIWLRPVWDDLWIRVRRLLPQRAAA